MSLFSDDDIDALMQRDKEPVPIPFSDGVSAAFEAGRLTDQSTSTHYQTADLLTRAFAGMRDNGIEAPELPFLITDGVAEASFAYMDSQRDAILARRNPDLGPVDPRLMTGEEARQSVRERVQKAQAEYARASGAAAFVGGLAVGATDPVNLAMLPLGLVSAEGLAARTLLEAGLGVASQSVVEAASWQAKERGGMEPTLGQSVANVAMTGAGAGALPGIFHGIGLAARRAGLATGLRRGIAEGKIKPTPQVESALATLDDAADTIPPGSSPAAESAHLDATAAAVDVLRAESPVEEAAAVRNLAERARLWSEASQRGAVDADAAVRAAEARVAELDAANPSLPTVANFAFDVARPGLSDAAAKAVGVEGFVPGLKVEAARIDGGVQVTVGDRQLFLYDDMGPEGARAALDTFTDAAGLERVPLSKRESAVAAVAKARNEAAVSRTAAELASREAERAAVVASRAIGQDIGQPGGRPFATKAEAEKFISRNGLEGTEPVTRPGFRGWVVREKPNSSLAPLAARMEQRAATDAAIARELADPTPAPVEPPPIDGPVARPTFDADEVAQVEQLRTLAAERPDIQGIIELDGVEVRGTVTELLDRIDAEIAELTDTVDCMTGGPV